MVLLSKDPLTIQQQSSTGTKCVQSVVCCCLQTYVTSSDKDFAAATIQAIGRCASTISEVTDTCLNGLVNLLSNRNGELPFTGRKHEGMLMIVVIAACRKALQKCYITVHRCIRK